MRTQYISVFISISRVSTVICYLRTLEKKARNIGWFCVNCNVLLEFWINYNIYILLKLEYVQYHDQKIIYLALNKYFLKINLR